MATVACVAHSGCPQLNMACCRKKIGYIDTGLTKLVYLVDNYLKVESSINISV